MEKLIKQILLVVDFSDRSRLVLDNLVSMANEMHCDIHLLNILEPSLLPFSFHSKQIITDKAEQKALAISKIRALQGEYIPKMKKGCFIHSHVLEGAMERTIRNFALQQDIDLTILTLRHRYAWSAWMNKINIARLARKIECPVLNIPRAMQIQQIRNIVLPVTDMLPLRKIMFASYIAKYHKARIHLVALQNEGGSNAAESNPWLYKSYQLLTDNTDLPIECHPMSGENIADTTLQYAEKVNADLIVVQPGQEMELPGLRNSIFSRFLYSASRIPVMAV
ncbi:MAG TPA: universal stress protein [Flavihumibacter sp.]|jgi:nucleotide-binding universal stress UspA family protein